MERAFSGNGNVFRLGCIDQGRIVIALDAFRANVHQRQVVGKVIAEMNDRPFADVEIDVAFYMYRTGDPIAGGDQHFATAGFAAGLDRLGDSVGALAFFVILPFTLNGPLIDDVKYPLSKDRPLQLRHIKRCLNRSDLSGYLWLLHGQGHAIEHRGNDSNLGHAYRKC